MALTRRAVIAWLLTLAVAPAATAAQEGEIERRVRTVASSLVAPCCFSQTLAQHSSAEAAAMKQDIRTRLQAGWSESDLVDAYVAKYGERILAAPTFTGFSVLAYVTPPLFLLSGAIFVASWLGRHRQSAS